MEILQKPMEDMTKEELIGLVHFLSGLFEFYRCECGEFCKKGEICFNCGREYKEEVY